MNSLSASQSNMGVISTKSFFSLARTSEHGFTLIELVMVIVILGVLAAVALPKFVNLGADARIAAVNGLAASVQTAVSVAKAKCAVTQACGTQTPYTSNPSITFGGQTYFLHFGYPTAWGNSSLNQQGDIAAWLQAYSGFTRRPYVSGTWYVDFTKDGSPNPLNCRVRYQILPINNVANPSITTSTTTVTISGC
jgi:prepilin-type N-terminal cleavage/methylation domain-containing protein